ncbi:STAS domain-containing protein [Streptomyces sp. NPDC102406]|uniref:STAS domain-containing protein n=1 Tax=Streptomyces sp. NPDC102406 TaxID=3366171 RepID=UPI003817F83D
MPESAPRLLIRPHQPTGAHVSVVALTGELDALTSAELREAVAGLAVRRERPAHLLLDLTGVTHCDNASLYTLLGICQALHLVGITVTLTNVGGPVLERIRSNSLDQRLPLAARLRNRSAPAGPGDGT